MTKYWCGLLLLGLFLAPVAAQEDYGSDDFEKFITKVLKKQFKKKVVKNDLVYSIEGGFRVLFDEENQKLAFFEQYTYELPTDGKKVMAAKLEAWNRKASLSKATEAGFTSLGKDLGSLHVVRFGGTFDIKKKGEGKLQAYYEMLDLEFEDFVIYMQDLLKHSKKAKTSSVEPPAPGDTGRAKLLTGISERQPISVVDALRNDLR